MTARAHVEFDPRSFGVRIAVQPWAGEDESAVLLWERPIVRTLSRSEVAPDESWLQLNEDVARAIYEALADHFGHSGHDARALRKDYEAERKRVDLFIAKAVKA